MRGDFPDSEKKPDEKFMEQPGKGWSFWRAFWECFKGFSRYKAHADLWLNGGWQTLPPDYFFARHYAMAYSSTPPAHNKVPSIRVGAEPFGV